MLQVPVSETNKKGGETLSGIKTVSDTAKKEHNPHALFFGIKGGVVLFWIQQRDERIRRFEWAKSFRHNDLEKGGQGPVRCARGELDPKGGLFGVVVTKRSSLV